MKAALANKPALFQFGAAFLLHSRKSFFHSGKNERKARREAQIQREIETRHNQLMERAQQEKAEREALARIPEHVKMAELLKDAKVSMATMSGSVYGSEMWTVKAVLTNCITVMDFIMREMFPGEEGSKHDVD